MVQTQAFTIERTYDAPPANVWKAITQKELLKQWYFDIPDFKAVAGHEFTFEGNGPCEKPNLHLCKITEVIPGKKLAYTWRYEGVEGSSLVTFELFPEGGKTRLRLTHAGLETFPRDLVEKKNFAAGWTRMVEISLPAFLVNN